MSLVKIESCEEKFQDIRMHLVDYLLEQGLDVRNGRKVKCINPEHDDNSPSMSVFETKEGNPAVHCFSCGFSADIFQAAHALEHKPIMGPSFIEDNVLYLANKYDIDVPTKALSEEEIYEMNTYQAYKATAEYISRCDYGEMQLAELEKRGWKPQFTKSLQIGCCDDYTNLRGYLKSLGFSAKFLDEIDLGNSKIFSQDNLIFTVHDDFGRPVGFAARNLKFDGVRDDNGYLVNGSKFNNTRTTGAKCNIYRKSERLYLLNRAKRKSPPLYIFEGYGDGVTAQQAGLENSSAIGSLELSHHHLNTCRRNGIYDVIICLDSDERGMEKARVLLDEVLNNVHDIKIRFIFLPEREVTDEEGNKTLVKVDPDIFIREEGLEAFLALPKIDPFVWRLQEFEKDDEATPESICFSMIPIMANEPSSIKRQSMVKELSAATGYSEKVIMEEIDKLKDSEEAKIQRSKQAVVDDLLIQLKNRNDSADILLRAAQDKLYEIDKVHKAGGLDTNTIINEMLAIKQYGEMEELHVGINMGPNFPTLQHALSGDLRGKMLLVGGTANTGKTTKFCDLAWNIAKHNDGVLCVVHTIDDSSKDLVPRLITYDIMQRAYHTNESLFNFLEINKVANPFKYKESVEYDALCEEREIAWKNYIKLCAENRLLVLDGEKGKSIDFISSTMRQLSEKHPDKQILFFIDNFHLVETTGEEEGRFKYKKLSSTLKSVAVANGATVISTVEYTKIPKGTKPSNHNIAETGQLDYDSNATIHLYNEVHDLQEESHMYFMGGPNGDTKYPIIEANFGKNKINSYKGTAFYKFYPDKAFYVEITREQAEALQLTNMDVAAERQRLLDERNQNNGPINGFE